MLAVTKVFTMTGFGIAEGDAITELELLEHELLLLTELKVLQYPRAYS